MRATCANASQQSLRGAAERLARNPYSLAVVMGSGLAGLRPRPGMTPKSRNAPRIRSRSFDRDLRRGGLDLALIVGPFELQRAAFVRHGEKGDERVRGNRLVQIGVEDFGAVIGANEIVDNVARDGRAGRIAPVAGFHDMRDQGLDLDRLAALGL